MPHQRGLANLNRHFVVARRAGGFVVGLYKRTGPPAGSRPYDSPGHGGRTVALSGRAASLAAVRHCRHAAAPTADPRRGPDYLPAAAGDTSRRPRPSDSSSSSIRCEPTSSTPTAGAPVALARLCILGRSAGRRQSQLLHEQLTVGLLTGPGEEPGHRHRTLVGYAGVQPRVTLPGPSRQAGHVGPTESRLRRCLHGPASHRGWPRRRRSARGARQAAGTDDFRLVA